jgi:hypothetical protein
VSKSHGGRWSTQLSAQAGYDPNRVSRDQVKYEPMIVLAHVAGALARAGRDRT